jgi:hypothetical protein
VKLLVDNIDLLTLSQDNSQAMPIDYYPIMNKDNIVVLVGKDYFKSLGYIC